MTSSTSSKAGLIIFLRNPQLGIGNRRIAASVGDVEALAIYNELLEVTRSVSDKYAGQSYLFYSSHIDEKDKWSNDFYLKNVQNGRDLGEKMSGAFAQVFQTESSAMIIGSDCPYLKPAHLDQVNQMLKENDVVIGPAVDGGYYLLAMGEFTPQLFQGVPWSQSNTFDMTIKRCQELGKSFGLLEVLNDVDTFADYEQWKNDSLKDQ